MIHKISAVWKDDLHPERSLQTAVPGLDDKKQRMRNVNAQMYKYYAGIAQCSRLQVTGYICATDISGYGYQTYAPLNEVLIC